MSRTDRHRPHWVQRDDPLEQNFQLFDQGGRWGWTKVFFHRTCGDRWCGMYYWRRADNRSRRHEEQRMAREVLKGADWI